MRRRDDGNAEKEMQESAQIPGFWNPMVKRCNGIFL
jgi:hypothetical protein